MERLDGYQVSLTGPNGRFTSTAILTNGPHGSCKLNNVPPGDYSLSMPIFQLNTTIKIPKSAGGTVTFDMKISDRIDITQR
jgi:hypothetical protein